MAHPICGFCWGCANYCSAAVLEAENRPSADALSAGHECPGTPRISVELAADMPAKFSMRLKLVGLPGPLSPSYSANWLQGFRLASGHMHVNSPLREYRSKKTEHELAVILASTSIGAFHADPDISGCCSNAGVGVSDITGPSGALSDSFLRLRWQIRRVWQRALLARRADGSSSNLAIRLLPGQ
jgi:hypothetical protein